MKAKVEKELKAEFREARLMCQEVSENPEVKGESGFKMVVMNNFWSKIPGGHFYWKLEGSVYVRQNPHQNIKDYFVQLAPHRVAELQRKSVKYLSNSYGGFSEEMSSALLQSDMSTSLLEEFTRVTNVNGIRAIFNRDRDANIGSLFGAYLIMRRSGYTQTDLI